MRLAHARCLTLNSNVSFTRIWPRSRTRRILDESAQGPELRTSREQVSGILCEKSDAPHQSRTRTFKLRTLQDHVFCVGPFAFSIHGRDGLAGTDRHPPMVHKYNYVAILPHHLLRMHPLVPETALLKRQTGDPEQGSLSRRDIGSRKGNHLAWSGTCGVHPRAAVHLVFWRTQQLNRACAGSA